MNDHPREATTKKHSGQSAAIIVAAGQGTRMGGEPKIMRRVADKPLIAHVLDAVEGTASVSEIIVVANPTYLDGVRRLLEDGPWSRPIVVVAGGDRRQDSVAAGLEALSGDIDIVAVHDGARPFAPAALFDAIIAAARDHGAAIAAIPMVDTLKRVRDGRIEATLDRTDLWTAQTPQAARVPLLRKAMALGLDVTDEAMLMEAIGQPVQVVEGSRFNIKVTHPLDLELAEAIARALAREA